MSLIKLWKQSRERFVRMAQLTDQSFIRHLPDRMISRLGRMLDPEDSWIELAQAIPVDPDSLFQNEGFEPRYSTDAIATIRSRQRDKTRMLLVDWGTTNCQLRHVIEALLQARLFEAANYLRQACGLEARPPPPAIEEEVQNPPTISIVTDTLGGISMTDTNAASIGSSIDTSGVELSKRIEKRPEDDSLLHLQYDLLSSITGKFDTKNMIGTGGFGDVFLGLFCNGLKVAVKRLKNNTEEDKKQFDAEIKALGSLRHEYLVTLLGYSCDGELQCLVYQFMVNGSLEDRLARLANTPPLSVAMRVEIARGTAKGMNYLHSNGITHRDIKSANILLNEEFVPKIGDFATARAAPNGMKNATQFTATAIIGTQTYLAPEAYGGKIHPDLDIYSFGVVLLELITGLPAFDSENREDADLKQHVLEYCTPYEDDDDNMVAGDIFDLRDNSVADGWTRNLVESLYKLSQLCLKTKARRIQMSSLLDKLEKIYET